MAIKEDLIKRVSTKVKSDEMSKKKQKWLYFGVIPTVFPVAVTVVFDLYVGYLFIQVIERHILELMLVVFAILVSVVSEALELRIYKDNKVFIGKMLFIGLIVISMYSFLYDKDHTSLRFLFLSIMIVVILGFITMKTAFKFYDEEEKIDKQDQGI